MSFQIPLSARASLNRIHKEGLPAVSVEVGELVTWRGMTATWTRAEKRAVAGLPASELAVLHELKSTLDAEIIA